MSRRRHRSAVRHSSSSNPRDQRFIPIRAPVGLRRLVIRRTTNDEPSSGISGRHLRVSSGKTSTQPAGVEVWIMADESETRTCPYCKEEIKVEATRCKHCGSWVTPERPSHKG